jgi:ketosteroid isomerase-like protein
MMRIKNSMYRAAICLLLTVSFAHAGDLRAQMEASNAEWLAAYNTQNGAAFPAFYAKDAMLLAPGGKPIVGAEAIGKHWADEIKDGTVKNHTWKILRVQRSGKTVYQVARFTVDLIQQGGKTKKIAGNTVRILELAPDGKWLTKVHIFNSDSD